MDESNKPHIFEEEVETISLSNLLINSDASDDRRLSTDPVEVFEFLSDFTSEISHAEEIIFCGKLMCLKGEVVDEKSGDNDGEGRRYESSLSIPRSSRSKLLRRSPSLCSSSSSNYKPIRSRWYALMFGHLKFPAEMDLHDIKNRQLRRTTVTPIPKSSWDWDFIKMLSCKDHASVDVNTSSFHCMSHA